MTRQQSCFLQSMYKSRSANKVQSRKESLKGMGVRMFLNDDQRFCEVMLHACQQLEDAEFHVPLRLPLGTAAKCRRH